MGRTVRYWFGSIPKWFSDPSFVQMRRGAADHRARKRNTEKREISLRLRSFAYIDDDKLKPAKA